MDLRGDGLVGLEGLGPESSPTMQCAALHSRGCSPNQLGWSDEGQPPPHRLWFPFTLLGWVFPAHLWVHLSGPSSSVSHMRQRQVPFLPAKDSVALSHRARPRATTRFPLLLLLAPQLEKQVCLSS